MIKNKIRLTESQLHRIIKESVENVLNEVGDTLNGADKLAMVDLRNIGRNGKPDFKGLNRAYTNGEETDSVTNYVDSINDRVNDTIAKLSDQECRSILEDIATWYAEGLLDENGQMIQNLFDRIANTNYSGMYNDDDEE